MKKALLLCPAFLLIMMSAMAQTSDKPKEILLWAKGAPGSEGKTGKESVRITDQGDHVISSIHTPSITPYLPARGKATGVAIIIAPGGGHRELWIDHEGYNPGQWFSDRGIAVFVLKYRLAKEPNSTYTVDEHSLMDIQRAIRYVRSRAREWKIDPHKIGVMGFSAGGEVAALSAMRYDNGKEASADTIERKPCRPDFQVLIYPGNSGRYEVTKETPPAFFICGYNDREDISLGMSQLYEKYKKAGVPAELHIYATAGHGFGLRATNKGAASEWPERVEEWLTDLKIIVR